MSLQLYFTESARRAPDQVAVVEPGAGRITYRELDRLSDRMRDRLCVLGVAAGDRVGIAMRKSIDTVAAICGILKLGAAYVPVDPGAPAARGAYILHNCGTKVAIIESTLEEKFADELRQLSSVSHILSVTGPGGGLGLQSALDALDRSGAADAVENVRSAPDDLAYILYTSGSTGKPKGVMLSQENAVSFVDWCSDVFEPRTEDRFSAHAPFHFDLSILDIHVALKHAATMVLIGEDVGKDPVRLARLIADERISIWYSAPSILSLLAQFGNLASYDYSHLRHILFAGEVFPAKHLRSLNRLLPKPRYFNLYGPTETNVCTWYEVPTPVPDDRTTPYPIGKVCSHLTGKVVDDGGTEVAVGDAGELCIAGRGVMQGYWAAPEQSSRGFLVDADGIRWYRTGDIVVQEDDGDYIYRGRRDRMVKRRGYRVELGEIEAGIYHHALIKEAAVVALPDEENGVRITAFLSCGDAKRPSLIEMKRFCSQQMPLYMIPDAFSWHQALPKTSTDKIDYQRLKQMLLGSD